MIVDSKKRNARRQTVMLLRLVFVSVLGCDGLVTAHVAPIYEPAPVDDNGQIDTAPSNVPSDTLRRLSVVEWSRSLAVLTGLEPGGLDSVPPDSFGFVYDRVVNGQSLGRAHVDGFEAVHDALIGELLGDRKLDDLAESCRDEIAPPDVASTIVTAAGASLAAGPEWAVGEGAEPTYLHLQYAPDPTANYTHNFSGPGDYRLELVLSVSDGPIDVLQVNIGGAEAATQTNINGAQTVVVEFTVADSGLVPIDFLFSTEPDHNNLTFEIQQLTIEGPLDDSAETFAEDRITCAHQLIDEFGPRVFRRPLTADEVEDLRALYAAGVTDGGHGDGVAMVLSALFNSPHFLFLVEVGKPVEGRPGHYALDAFELAARLSYAICEEPPDETLSALALSGGLLAPGQVSIQAARLLKAECGRHTMNRFFTHWLGIEGLGTLPKDPEVYPSFTDEVRAGLVAESEFFFSQVVYDAPADFSTLMGGDFAFVDPRSAALWGLPEPTEPFAKTTLGPERRGVLTHPGVMAASALFDGTSPVRRGLFVLENLLCLQIPAAPENLVIVPPVEDPTLTTRERWAAHSNNEGCAVCHQNIDPVGFALEDFDGVGQHRQTENGRAIDASGGVKALGYADGDLDGGAALASALAESDLARECFARQWLRFSLGRLEGQEDGPAVSTIRTSLGESTLIDALSTLYASDSFTHRVVEVDP